MFSIRPVIIFILSLVMVTACAPAQKPTPSASAKLASLPIAILDSNGAARIPNTSSQVATGTDALLLEVRDLVFQRRADLLARPGWIHLVTRSDGIENSLSSLWGTASETRQEEEWLELDADGQVIRAVKRLLNDDLQPLQTGVLMNKTWWNLTFHSAQLAEDSSTFDPNYGFYDLTLRLIQDGHRLSKGTIYKECWYQGEQYSISEGDFKYEAVFNPDRRSLRWLKTWRVSPGPLALVESKEILIEERVDQPPAEILALLDDSRQITLR